MTNKLAVILSLALLLPHSANATDRVGNISGTFPCFDFLELKKKLEDEHGELPFISSEGLTTLLNMETEKFELAPHRLYMFANPQTFRYTLVFKMGNADNGLGCIISSGGNLGPVVKETGI